MLFDDPKTSNFLRNGNEKKKKKEDGRGKTHDAER